MYDADEYAGDTTADDVALRPVRDLAGLAVEDASGIPVGQLFGALVEADTGLVRYVDLDLSALDRHVLVPIGHTRIREQDHQDPRMRLRAALLEELERIPPFPADVKHIDDPFERALLEAYGRTFHGERYYAHPSYDHNGIYIGEHQVVSEEQASDGDEDGDERPDGLRHPGQHDHAQLDHAHHDNGLHDHAHHDHAHHDQAHHDAGEAGDGEPPAGAGGPLRRLSYLPGWRVAKGETDIRRWPLVLEDGEALVIRDLIIEPAAGKVRYVVVGDSGPTTRLLPIGFLQIAPADERVHAPGLTAEAVRTLPPYDGGGVTREQEDRLHGALRRSFSGRRLYQLPDYRGGGG